MTHIYIIKFVFDFIACMYSAEVCTAVSEYNDVTL